MRDYKRSKKKYYLSQSNNSIHSVHTTMENDAKRPKEEDRQENEKRGCCCDYTERIEDVGEFKQYFSNDRDKKILIGIKLQEEGNDGIEEKLAAIEFESEAAVDTITDYERVVDVVSVMDPKYYDLPNEGQRIKAWLCGIANHTYDLQNCKNKSGEHKGIKSMNCKIIEKKREEYKDKYGIVIKNIVGISSDIRFTDKMFKSITRIEFTCNSMFNY